MDDVIHAEERKAASEMMEHEESETIPQSCLQSKEGAAKRFARFELFDSLGREQEQICWLLCPNEFF